MKFSISIVGSGNLATHLAALFINAGYSIESIVSRNKKTGLHLAKKSHAHYFSDLKKLNTSSQDFIFLCVPDHVIEQTSKSISKQEFVVHCSGSTDIEALKQTNKGVFWPLQTFKHNQEVTHKSFPIVLEANNKASLSKLEDLAKTIKHTSYVMPSNKRRALHLAAVMANNFTNHILHYCMLYLKANKLNQDLLSPLIKESIEKAVAQGAHLSQTGPAIRNDENTLNHHLKMLEDQEDLVELYKFLTHSIQKLSS